MSLRAIKWQDGRLEILDQLLLPKVSRYVEVADVQDGWDAIYKMQVRGAPAIAIVGCLSLAAELHPKTYTSTSTLCEDVKTKLSYLVTARPTAVNMKQAADEISWLAEQLLTRGVSPAHMKDEIIAAITAMLAKDVANNRAIGDHGAAEILKRCPTEGKLRVITHCNTGSLATAGYGTALGVVRSLHSNGKIERVYCTETRPYNQGARLTAYELVHERIPGTLICDDMVASLMKSQKIAAVIVGADRVVANGDTANKIGTYQIAVLAKHHGVLFYVAAPFTTIDFSIANGDGIRIEERPHSELTCVNGVRIAAEGIDCWNPAFDVTPAELITGIITERGVYKPSELAGLRG